MERLIAPTDFTSPAASRKTQEDLVPPSHFASSVQSGGTKGVTIQGTTPSIPWINPGATSVTLVSGDPSAASPWLAITQAQQEILELRKENQRILMLQRESIKGRTAGDHPSDLRARSADRSELWAKWESEWRLEAEKHKALAERLKGQVEALKESAGRHREEMRDRDSTLNRQNHELEAMREELSKAKTELSLIREDLTQRSMQKEKITSELERLKSESAEEIARLRRDIERGKEKSQELTLKAEMRRLQAEEETKQQTMKLLEELEDMQRKQEAEVQQLNASHVAEMGAMRQTNSELQDKLQSITSEVLKLKHILMDVTTERDRLKEDLSQMEQAFKTQSVTLHSLRNYIGQLAPEKGEKERLNEVVEKLNKEKAALQKTTELLSIRLNSLNEILTLQEEKMVKKTSTDPLVKNGSEVLHVLQLWREKVFKLCVQLRSKDIELKAEKDKLQSKVRLTEQQLKQEQHLASVLQHSLEDRIAELDLERVEKETLIQELTQAQQENSQLKSKSQKAEAELKILSEMVHRFSLGFESKVAEVDAAQTRLNAFTQRLCFAKRRVETIQGLFMRRVALQKVQQASKQADQVTKSITNLQTELSVACEERNKLTQELKRTPELIEKALVDLKEQYENKLTQKQEDLEQSWLEVRQAVAGREEAEQNLQQIQVQLEDSMVNLDKVRSDLLLQQEHSERALQERVSEIEDRCAEKLRKIEVQLNTARREHTKAVMTLRQFEREAVRKQDEMREIHFGSEHTRMKLQNKLLKENDKSTLLASVVERDLMSGYTRHTMTPHSSDAPREQQKTFSESSHSLGAKVPLPADERILTVLEELRNLSAAVVNSSEDSAEEDGHNDSAGPVCTADTLR